MCIRDRPEPAPEPEPEPAPEPQPVSAVAAAATVGGIVTEPTADALTHNGSPAATESDDPSSNTPPPTPALESSQNEGAAAEGQNPAAAGQGEFGVVWEEDDAVTHCRLCNAKFGLFKRKHHCRFCGRVTCSQCAANKAPHPNAPSSKPHLICDKCVDPNIKKLSKAEKQKHQQKQEKALKDEDYFKKLRDRKQAAERRKQAADKARNPK
eukprot:TRINITY_DN9514_c0_g1_i1.p1 TRINITY_DN9514_c0_g1~~TRINITY_DN9514_c0_g1_i1.p1  ORF type:complete len:210 (+),score=60.00 TRINITY_DN9514_c0_g1_i1:76-705(+)